MLDDLQPNNKEDGKVAEGDERRSPKKRKLSDDGGGSSRKTTATVAPQIPLPPVPEGAQDKVLNDLKSRAMVSSESLPSAVMCTIQNPACNCVQMLYDGGSIAGGFDDCMVRIFDSVSGRPMASAEDSQQISGDSQKDSDMDEQPPNARVLTGHSKPVYGLSWFPDYGMLLSSSGDGTVRLWSEMLADNIAVFQGSDSPVWDVTACPRGYYFASASSDGTASLWCTERLQPLRIFAGIAGQLEGLDAIEWHSSCNFLATGASNGVVKIWDVASGRCVRIFHGPKGPITSLAFGSDDTSVYCGGLDGSIWGWDVAGAQSLGNVNAHKGPVWSLGFSRGSGGLLASGGNDATVCLWSSSDSDFLKRECTWHTRPVSVQTLFWTPRNLLLAAGAQAAVSERGDIS
eukprot:evm.model.scf_1162.2 EVM.evm.TU.scf_1162.2   scf_1162:14347-20072(-)